MSYRIHIDAPLGEDLEKARELTEMLVIEIKRHFKGVELVQYKLSNDNDRAQKNYMDINENGHCSNKKTKIEFHSSGT